MSYDPESPPIGGSAGWELWNIAREDGDRTPSDTQKRLAARWQLKFALSEGPKGVSEAVDWQEIQEEREAWSLYEKIQAEIEGFFGEHQEVDWVGVGAVTETIMLSGKDKDLLTDEAVEK